MRGDGVGSCSGVGSGAHGSATTDRTKLENRKSGDVTIATAADAVAAMLCRTSRPQPLHSAVQPALTALILLLSVESLALGGLNQNHSLTELLLLIMIRTCNDAAVGG